MKSKKVPKVRDRKIYKKTYARTRAINRSSPSGTTNQHF